MHKKALWLPTDISILGKKYSWQIDVASLQSGSVGAGGGGESIPPPRCWFSFNNSEAVKAVKLWRQRHFSNTRLIWSNP